MDTNEQLLMTVGRIEGKLDTIAAWAIRHEADDKELAARVTLGEKWRAYFIGGAAAVGAITGTGSVALAKLIGLIFS